jgi:7-cyano-7-deazaguanine synthase
MGGSSLTDPEIEVSNVNPDYKGIPSSYVPFRNANILSAAVSWGEVIAARRIFIGAVEEDSSGYPDCRQIFYEAFNKVIDAGTKPDTDIIIETPLIHMMKHEIVKKGVELDAPFELTWSCYCNEDKACGTCDSCALRLKGFQLAGIDDPIEYIARPVYAELRSGSFRI